MKFAALALTVLFSSSVFASQTCEVTEVDKETQVTHNVVVATSDDPHGSVAFFKLQKLSETFGGFVALMGDVVVISINHVPTGVASASHTPVAAKRAYHQLLLPGNHISQMQGVTVFCKEDGLPDGVVGM